MPEGFLQSHSKKRMGLFLESFQSLFLKSPVEFDIFQIEFGTKREISDLKLSYAENSPVSKNWWHLLILKVGGFFSGDRGKGGGGVELSPPQSPV